VLSEISKACKLPLATTHRLLANLVEMGYVICQSGGYYKLSTKLFELANSHMLYSDLISSAHSYFEELSDQINESVHLLMRVENDVVCVDKVTKNIGIIQMASRIGVRIPMYRCASGKCILATLDDKTIKQIFDSTEIIKATEHTITQFDDLMKNIYEIRKRGYAIDDEESEIGVKCIALYLGNGPSEQAPQYAFSISSLSSRMTPERLDDLYNKMIETKQNILKELFIA
jgi:IclR family KDG regulon transcriptional repressor